jgi:predicted transcriptional regulator
MPRKPSSTPTETEMEILSALWRRGPSSVRQVHQELAATRETGYSTTLKMMQVMVEKGLLVKDDTVRPQVYRPADTQQKTQRSVVRHVIDTVFEGSTRGLLLRAISDRNLKPEELDEIQAMIDRARQERDA